MTAIPEHASSPRATNTPGNATTSEQEKEAVKMATVGQLKAFPGSTFPVQVLPARQLLEYATRGSLARNFGFPNETAQYTPSINVDPTEK